MASARRAPIPFETSVPVVEEALRAYHSKHGILPTLSELLTELKPRGITSKGTLSWIIGRLVEAGILALTHGATGRLKPGPGFSGFPIGRPVPAGIPDTGEAAPEERRSIDAWLAPRPAATRLVPIRGESMIGVGLLDGDMAVFEAATQARVGDIVYAVIDGAETLKILAEDAAGRYLEPANPDPQYRPLRPKHSLEILGVVIGSFGRRGRSALRG